MRKTRGFRGSRSRVWTTMVGCGLALATGLGASAATTGVANAASKPSAAALAGKSSTRWSHASPFWSLMRSGAGAFGSASARSWQPGLSWSAMSKIVAGDESLGSLAPEALPPAAPTPWEYQVDAGTILYGTSTISCASATDCYATASSLGHAGATFLVSTDGGKAWSLGTPPAGQLGLDAIACPATGTCFVGSVSLSDSQEIFVTHNGGASWVQQKIPSSVAFADIECRSTEDCIAVGITQTGALALVTTNGGTTWTSHNGPAKSLFEDVTCPSANDCDAVGYNSSGDALIATSSDGGSEWHSASLPATTGALVSIACPSTAECVAVGGHTSGSSVVALGFATYDAGAKWSPVTFPSGHGPVNGVACPTTSECIGVSDDSTSLLVFGGGASALVSGDGGHSWRSVALPVAGEMSRVVCPTRSACATSGASLGLTDRLLTTSNGGSTWSTAVEPPGELLFDISCSSGRQCAAVGESNVGAAAETTSDGSTWEEHAVAGLVGLVYVSCPAATTDCYGIAANSSGAAVFVESADGGANWKAGNSFGTTNSPDSLDCPAAKDCYFVLTSPGGQTLLEATTTGGATGTWRSITVPHGTGQDTGAEISCPSTTECVLAELNGGIETTTDSGAHWTTALMPGGIEALGPLSCGSATTCVTLALLSDSVETLVSTNTGKTFVAGGGLSSSFVPTALACGGASSCELLGAEGSGAAVSLTTTDTGTSWTTQTNPGRLGTLGEWVALACPSAGRCEADALGPEGSIYIFGLG